MFVFEIIIKSIILIMLVYLCIIMVAMIKVLDARIEYNKENEENLKKDLTNKEK